LIAALLAAATPAAQAQLGGLLEKLVPPALRASDAAPPPPGAVPAAGTQSQVLAGEAPPVGPRKDIRPEMQPDADCSRPQERFNVAEKLAEYGGAEATLRLQRLIETDYRYSDLKPEDREMLQYLARTTVWVPAEVETKLGQVFTGAGRFFGGGTDKPSELDQAALAEIEGRLNRLRGTVTDFPGTITLRVNKQLADGAYARFGGVIELSERFLAGLTEAPQAADFLLAHELSHVYKRHAMKHLQFTLISTDEGWELGRKLLQRAQRGLAVDPVRDGLFMFTTVPQLVEFVRGLQLKFGREQELEADACSKVWMGGIGVDPFAAWDAYRVTLGANSDQSDRYVASHPSDAEREARFKRPPGPPKKGDPAAGKRPRKP